MYLEPYQPKGPSFLAWFALLCAVVWAWLCSELLLRL